MQDLKVVKIQRTCLGHNPLFIRGPPAKPDELADRYKTLDIIRVTETWLHVQLIWTMFKQLQTRGMFHERIMDFFQRPTSFLYKVTPVSSTDYLASCQR